MKVSLALYVLCLAAWAHTGRSSFGQGSTPSPTSDDSPKLKYTETQSYNQQELLGWTVLVHPDLIADEQLCLQTLSLLKFQLFQVSRAVPKKPLAQLKTVKIWVELNHPKHPCAVYHPNVRWLEDNGMNPDKVDCVELSNANNFLKWTRDQPWMVLHELSHAYHEQFLENGFGNAEIKKQFKRVAESKIYEKVQRINGREEKAYALTNPMEYFAENSEAFFGTNDFYPFVRSELKAHDPQTFEMMQKLWHSNQGR